MNLNKIIIFLCSFIILIAFSCENNEEDDSISEPKPTTLLSLDSLSDLSSDIPADLYIDLTFVNDTTGYAISNNGRIIKTTNAGKNWIQLNSPTKLPLEKIQFIDEKTGFIIGGDNKNGIFLKTIDGGLTWIIQTLNTPKSPTAIYFLNDSIGYIVGFDLLIKTVNGGQNWYNIKNNYFRIYEDIKFKNNDLGIIPLKNGAYLKTNDGGQTWDSIKCRTDIPFSQVFFSTFKIFFWSESHLKLITIDSSNVKNITQIPLLNKILFLNEYQSIGIGQYWEKDGYFSYGVIYITDNTWAKCIKKTYSPGEATSFTAIAKMTNKKIMILGTGFNSTKIVILNI